MQVFTARFANKRAILASGAVPVAISLGQPKWPLGYEIRETFAALCPEGWMLRVEDFEKYRRGYRHKLHQLTPAKIAEGLQDISRRNGGRDLVLLCWEDLGKPGVWCHRRIFAKFWLEETGEIIDELPEGGEGAQQSEPESQPTLF